MFPFICNLAISIYTQLISVIRGYKYMYNNFLSITKFNTQFLLAFAGMYSGTYGPLRIYRSPRIFGLIEVTILSECLPCDLAKITSLQFISLFMCFTFRCKMSYLLNSLKKCGFIQLFPVWDCWKMQPKQNDVCRLTLKLILLFDAWYEVPTFLQHTSNQRLKLH